MTPDKREVWFEKFWELVDASENYSTIDERITAREKLEEYVTQHHQDLRQEERDRAVQIIKDELKNAPLEVQMIKGVIFANIINKLSK